MTDSSSKNREDLADITAELINTKIENARQSSQMTHVLRVGSFHMEIVPEPETDVRAMFNEVLDKLMNRYEEKLLEGDAGGTKEQRHYG
tara:strand:- start:58 stop:324 length:267 start_codon:yes stop_codon:yes gene_type:complete